MDVKRAKPSLPRTALSTLRVRLFLAGVLVSGGAAGAAGQPAAAPPRRAAALLAPLPLGPDETPAVARGAAEDSPPVVTGSTPAIRPGGRPLASGGPAWLNGIDPNVVPAGATGSPPAAGGRSLAPTASTRTGLPPADPPAPRTADRWKGYIGPEQQGGGEARQPADPNAPLRGVAANGAPVLAGPPAYRWYGWAAPTPGANPFAPSGQYPRASGNWYAVTGATPGAFPVPVMNPYRPAPGSEPPAYYATLPAARPAAVPVAPYGLATGAPAAPARAPAPAPVRSPAQPVATPPTVSPPKFNPAPPTPVMAPRPDPTPSGAQLDHPAFPPGPASRPTEPEPRASLPSPPPVGLPALTPPPTLPSAAAPPPAVLPVASPEPVAAVLPPVMRPQPEVKQPTVTPAALPSPRPTRPVPAAFPAAVTEEIQWRSNPDKTVPAPPGTWVPVKDTLRVPEASGGEGVREPGAADTTRPPVARAQGPDTDRQPDPVTTLVQAICRGRADGVDVRWTGSRKIAVCFEVGSNQEASALVKEISARRELAPYQIDFAVFVK